jgi:hypothetical protein
MSQSWVSKIGAIWAVIALYSWIIWPVSLSASQPDSGDRKTVLLLVGAPGEPEFGTNFTRQAELWTKACAETKAACVVFGLESAPSTSEYNQLKTFLEHEPKAGSGELWLVLIGHGTFDGKESRFNLRGPDLAATELAQWLQPFDRPTAVINTTASSAPFVNKLSRTNRVVITATRSGNEQSFARFGQYFAAAIASAQADLDKDGQTSLLEAFLMASRQATEFYKVEGRLPTEHALLDDNGDAAGTPADWFQGVRAIKKPRDKSIVDGLFAHQWHLVPGPLQKAFSSEQHALRKKLEHAVLLHREKKSQLPPDAYYAELEKLLLDLARFYESSSSSPETNNAAPNAENLPSKRRFW